MQKELLSAGEVAEQIFCGRVSVHTIRRWIAKGVGSPPVKLVAARYGGVYYIRRDSAEAFLQAAGDPELYRRRQTSQRTEKAKRQLVKAGA